MTSFQKLFVNSNIIPFKAEYKSTILTIWEQSVLATHDFLSPEDFKEIREMLSGFNFEELDVYCQIHDNKIVGFIGIHNHKIEMLFLLPEYMGKGLGRNLVTYAVKHHQANQVDVNEQNENALKFYEKFGFTVYERTAKDDLGKDYPILKMKLA